MTQVNKSWAIITQNYQAWALQQDGVMNREKKPNLNYKCFSGHTPFCNLENRKRSSCVEN